MDLFRPARKTLLALACLAAALGLLAAASGAGAATWVINGRGFGHGIGMSQYGAEGMARAGKSYGQILRHYYSGTRVPKLKKARSVRVLIGTESGSVSFSGASTSCGTRIDPSRTYVGRQRGNGVVLARAGGRTIKRCGRRLSAKAEKAVSVAGIGAYRGEVDLVATGGAMNLVNQVPINSYVKGVVPKEMSPSWHMAALEAQAVAARSYALSSTVDGAGFDLYGDSRSQAYYGMDAETKRTNRACAKTASRVVTYRGKIAQTFYMSTSGGHTEDIENVFFGPAIPYLRGVPDPYDRISPYHTWRVAMSQSEIDAKLAGYLKGRLRRVRITQRGASPRVVWARLYGSGGMTKIRGDQLQFALGLMDRWISFKKR